MKTIQGRRRRTNGLGKAAILSELGGWINNLPNAPLVGRQPPSPDCVRYSPRSNGGRVTLGASSS